MIVLRNPDCGINGFLDLDTISTHCQLEPGLGGDLVEILSKEHAISPQKVRLSNSSLELTKTLLSTIDGPVAIPVPDYFEFPGFCRQPVLVQRKPGFDIPYIPASCSAVLVSNPNNPTGILNNLKGLLEQTRNREQLLIVDEAYIEFAGEQHSVAKLVEDNRHLVVLRTMSKFYSMCSDKLAYALGSPEILGNLEVAEPSQPAIELAAKLIRAKNKLLVRKDVLARRHLTELLLEPIANICPSRTNFIMTRGRGLHLADYFASIGVQGVDLDQTPGIRNKGYVRVAVGGYNQIGEFARRLSR